MASVFLSTMICCCILDRVILLHAIASASTFNQNYYAHWGWDHFTLLEEGAEEVQLLIDQSSGAGFRSKLEYESGRFHVRMKIPEQRTGGLIPNFYLTSGDNLGNHSELDFEFMGTNGVLQTNVFASDSGGREQRFHLWFDPSEDFHSYDILWNQHQVVFFVDDIPIRVYKNYTALGGKFPSEPMQIEATIWSGDWAGQVNWSLSPFITHYRDFSVTACPRDDSHGGKCFSPDYVWNAEDQWNLSAPQRSQLNSIRNSSMFYDYCTLDGSIDAYLECSISDE